MDLIIVAAGKGLRFGGDMPKQFLELAGKPVLAHTIDAFQIHPKIGRIIVVGPEDWLFYIADEIVDKYKFDKVNHIVSGGQERQDSVLAGLNALGSQTGPVLIHDGARPLVTAPLIDRVIAALDDAPSVVPAVAVTDTVKVVEGDFVSKSLQRDKLRAVQTPQGFHVENLRTLLLQAQMEKRTVTDEAMLMEENDIAVALVDGQSSNLKITSAFDLKIAELILKERDL
ncbi:MAG: 2-C-methyl-D-erythritol 4-phosphate cytidylyltransferase [Deferribacteres bacterium]|nr:2-C-methyl-D-erythritol 4-phosphate cytidylyltransferase [candidate division KSB1 bacterium]MCB9502618.1 2-C-methyl-D-erythritol 4-phosphate cytidylyltransferase [Deferribacteres bacterium]